MKTAPRDIEARSPLTGNNQFELLLFRLGADSALGQSELFGINVFKIREIVAMPSICLLYTSPSPRDKRQSRMPSSA